MFLRSAAGRAFSHKPTSRSAAVGVKLSRVPQNQWELSPVKRWSLVRPLPIHQLNLSPFVMAVMEVKKITVIRARNLDLPAPNRRWNKVQVVGVNSFERFNQKFSGVQVGLNGWFWRFAIWKHWKKRLTNTSFWLAFAKGYVVRTVLQWRSACLGQWIQFYWNMASHKPNLNSWWTYCSCKALDWTWPMYEWF